MSNPHPSFKFTKGHKRGGRPKGSKAKVYLSLDYWFRALQSQWMELTPNQRAKYSLEAFKALLSKTNSLPQDPSASLPDTTNIVKLIRDLEANIQPEALTPYAIPKSDSSEEAKAVLEPQSKLNPDIDSTNQHDL